MIVDATIKMLKKEQKNNFKKIARRWIRTLYIWNVSKNEKMEPQPARPRTLHTYEAYKTSTDLDGPKDFPICILKSFTFLELPFNYLPFGTIFIPCGFCSRLHCVVDQRVQ